MCNNFRHHVLLVTQYYPPEVGGGAQRSSYIAEGLRALGMNVTVIAPHPTYLMKSTGKVSRPFIEKQIINEIPILRTYVYSSDRGSFIKRIIYYLSFSLSAIWAAYREIKDVDYIITISPPLFTGIAGVFIKKLTNSKLIFDIGDLWPESAVKLGFLRNSTIIKLSERLESWIYKNSDALNSVTVQTQQKLEFLHPYVKRVNYIPNMVDTQKIKKTEKNLELVDKLNLRNSFVAGYAGNIGSAQGIRIITKAAQKLKGNKDIKFIIIGDGVESDKVRADIKDMELDNLLFLPPIPRESIKEYLSLFDCSIIPLVKNELFKITIPSKLYECMAAEIPVILCVDGEARKILEKSGAGYFVEPENSQMLAEMILRAYENQNLWTERLCTARKIVEEEFDRDVVTSRLFDEIMDLTKI